MTRTRPFAAAAALIAALTLTLTGCGDDSSPKGSTEPSSASSTAQADPRGLADWAAVTLLDQESTDICDVGTSNLAERFGEQGWCEEDLTFKQTPVSLDLVATCNATARGGKTATGTLYAYHVEPSIAFTDDGGTDGGIIVIVDQPSGTPVVNDLYTTSLDPDDLVIGSCPHGGIEPLTESIPME